MVMNVGVPEWQGDNPFQLLIVRNEQQTLIDLDERGWLETYKDLLRGESTWHLVEKSGLIMCSLVVQDGEQPYYVARHFARVDGSGAKVTAYGIGKKRRDGHVDRFWVLTTGQVCIGDDVDIFGRVALTQM